jgi:hypothetical protein
MNAKIKAALLFIIVLIIGMAIGFEISEISIRNKFHQMEQFRKPRGFVEMFDEIIRPSDIQKATVDSILIKYHQRIDQVTQSNMVVISNQIDSMKVELRKILQKDQIDRLDEEMSRMKHQPPLPPNDGRPPMPDGHRPPPGDNGYPPPERRP